MERAEFAAAIKDKYITHGTGDIGKRYEVYDALFHTGSKMIEHIGQHERPCISVSGGSKNESGQAQSGTEQTGTVQSDIEKFAQSVEMGEVSAGDAPF